MNKINEDFRRLCIGDSQRSFNVVVTLNESSSELQPKQLGVELETIAGLPGILKGRLTGEIILELCKRNEVAEVTEDYDVELH